MSYNGSTGNVKNDIKNISQLSEKELENFFIKNNILFTKMAGNFPYYDFKVDDKAIEVKEDFACKRTNNVALEIGKAPLSVFDYVGKIYYYKNTIKSFKDIENLINKNLMLPSGLSITTADYFYYKIHTYKGIIWVKIDSKTLKEKITTTTRIVKTTQEKVGNNQFVYLNALFSYKDFINFGERINITEV